MNHTTAAQRHNARQDKIWERAKQLKTQTRFNASSRHSPLPWEYQYSEHTQEPRVLARSRDMCIATGFGNGPEAEANAKLIVRAVNHADKLAEALRDLRTRIVATGPNCLNTTKADEVLAAYEAAQ